VTNTAAAPIWHTEHHQVLDFARILAAAGTLTTATDALDYLAGPHRFDPEHALWIRSGRPHPPSADDLAAARMLGRTSPQAIALRRQHQAAGAAWDAFCDLLDGFDHSGRQLRLVEQP
jgi:hypothetical protein